MNLIGNLHRLSTGILRYPSGRYGIVGSIPAALTEPQRTGTPQYPPLRVSKVWETEQEAIDALLAIGITHFQRADCSWYDADPLPTGEQQARLPGDVGAVRDLEVKTEPIADVPFSLTPPPYRPVTIQAELWYGPGDFARKVGR